MKHPGNSGIDLRTTIYQSLQILVVAALVAMVLKFFFVDTIKMTGNQMSPTLLHGDRVLIIRIPFAPLLKKFIRPVCGKIVVFKNDKTINVLRIAAMSPDTIRIDSGVVHASGNVSIINTFKNSDDPVVPEDYAPKDFFDTYAIPSKHYTFEPGKLPLRDFFFAASIIRQENSGQNVYVRPYLLLDDSICKNYHINDFMFYNGLLDTIPDTLRNNWFFWNRLEEYLYQKYADRKVSLYFTVEINGTVSEQYTVRDNYLFLMADNRKNGFDSRYTGPLGFDRCIGTAAMVLWSHYKDAHGKVHFRFNRLGRFIR